MFGNLKQQLRVKRESVLKSVLLREFQDNCRDDNFEEEGKYYAFDARRESADAIDQYFDWPRRISNSILILCSRWRLFVLKKTNVSTQWNVGDKIVILWKRFCQAVKLCGRVLTVLFCISCSSNNYSSFRLNRVFITSRECVREYECWNN